MAVASRVKPDHAGLVKGRFRPGAGNSVDHEMAANKVFIINNLFINEVGHMGNGRPLHSL
jgi:hypothetical protein